MLLVLGVVPLPLLVLGVSLRTCLVTLSGLAGRGVAISPVGVYWMAAAIQGEPSKAHELGGALQAVQQNSKGWLLLLTLGVALAASSLFDFVEAFYHRPRLAGHAAS